MFWKLILVAVLVWAAGLYYSVTLGGLLHLIPVAVVIFVVVRRTAKAPNTEFGRWRSREIRSRDRE